MSGEDVPYHLRVNKFVERQLFLDLLEFVHAWNGPTKYAYASMGGRFLEDFKAINDRFSVDLMISIEKDAATYKRQLFNRPTGMVDCRHQSSGEFIDEFDLTRDLDEDFRFIVWLDFAAANERQAQLQEIEALARKLRSGDVLKVTLNANPQSKYKKDDFKQPKLFAEVAAANIAEQLAGYVATSQVDSSSIREDRFASLISTAVKSAVLKGVGTSGLAALPLGIYRYSDGPHQMTTVAAVFCDEALLEKANSDRRFRASDFASRGWSELRAIKVPDLSPRERYFIDQLIKADADPDVIHATLGLELAPNEESAALLRSYVSHYRRYPTFLRSQL